MNMQNLTAAQIRSRLEEIHIAEESHAQRDLDAELQDVMRSGGDIDALEDVQLEAERAARRLRVERVALEAALPDARKREGAVEMAELGHRHDSLAQGAEEIAKELSFTWGAFRSAVDRWESLQRQAMELSHDGATLHHQTGADIAQLGFFNSAAVVAVQEDFAHHGEYARRVQALHTAQLAVDTSAGRFQRPLTGEAA